MQKLTWKELLEARRADYLILFSLWVIITGICIATLIVTGWWPAPNLIIPWIVRIMSFGFLVYLIRFVINDKKTLNRCLKCGEMLTPFQCVKCPNCGKVCQKCGMKIEAN